MKKQFVIVLHAYLREPQNEKVNDPKYGEVIVKHSPGKFIGGVAVYCSFETLEQAKERAKEVWKDNYPGCVRQVFVKDRDCNILFKADNFNLLPQ